MVSGARSALPHRARRWPNRPRVSSRDLARRLWRAALLPYWLGTGLPPPDPPTFRRRRVGAGAAEFIARLDLLSTLVSRQRRDVLIPRTMWLIAAVVDVQLFTRLRSSPAFSTQGLLVTIVGLVTLAALALAAARPSRERMARAVDRSFDLRDRVRTALDGAESVPATSLATLQRDEASELLDDIAESRAFERRAPRRELLLLALALLTLVVLALITVWPGGPGSSGGGSSAAGAGRGGSARAGQPSPAGATGNPSGPAQASPEPSPGPGELDRRDLEALAAVLRRHALTKRAGDLIIADQLVQAAAAVREAGSAAGTVTQDARRTLAADLRQAVATTMTPDGVLTRDAAEVAAALEAPTAATAPAAFNQLAADIERAARGQLRRATPRGGPSSPAASDTAAARGTPPAGPTPPVASPGPLLGTDGRPVELPPGPNRGTATTLPAARPGSGPATPGATGASSGAINGVPFSGSGADNNTVPPDRRGGVERYFSPAPTGAP